MNRLSALMCVVMMVLFVASGVGCQSTGTPCCPDCCTTPPLTAFLVRHAEKMNESRDAPLSMRGVERVRSLSSMLRDAELDGVFSTDYRRTRGTAEPVAAMHGVEVELYEANDLEEFAAQLRERGGRILIAGHSNTTPDLVAHLGGVAGEPIVEATEYDRLYVVTIDQCGVVSTTLLRY